MSIETEPSTPKNDHVNDDGDSLKEQIEPDTAEGATLAERARRFGKDALEMMRVGAGIPHLQPDRDPAAEQLWREQESTRSKQEFRDKHPTASKLFHDVVLTGQGIPHDDANWIKKN